MGYMYIQKQCYAAILGGCVGSLDKEHYISRSILEIGKTRAVQVTGLPWQKKPTQSVGINSLVSKVLCKEHNGVLSRAVDPAGKRFFQRFVYAATQLVTPHETGLEYTCPENGTLLERWLLKYICGSWAAGNFARIRKGQERYQPALGLVEIVFGCSVLSEPCGLWLGGGNRKEFMFSYPFTMGDTLYFSNDYLLGVIFEINGIKLILNLTNDPEHLAEIVPTDASYHPSSLMIVSQTQTGKGGMHHISFDWGDRPVGKPVWIHRTREW